MQIKSNNSIEFSLYDDIVNSIDNFIYVLDEKGKFVFANSAFSVFIGEKEDKLIGESYRVFFSSKEISAITKARKQLKEPPHRIIYETQIISKEETKHILWEFTAKVDNTDRIIKIIANGRDITTQKKIQNRNIYEEQLLGGIANVTQVLLDTDMNKGINKALKILGKVAEVDRCYYFSILEEPVTKEIYSRQDYEWVDNTKGIEQQIINPELQYVPMSDMDLFNRCFLKGDLFTAIVSELEDEIVKEILESQGIVSILLIPVFLEGDLSGFVGFDDCTRRREWSQIHINFLKTASNTIGAVLKKEEYRRKSNLYEKRAKVALEVSNIGLWDWKMDTNEVFYSHGLKKMLGYEDHEFLNNLDEWKKRVHPDDLVSAMNSITNCFDGHTETYSSEHRIRTKDGKYKWILDKGKVVEYDERGKPLRMIGTHTDINTQYSKLVKHKKNEIRLNSILNAMQDNIFLISRELVVVGCFINQDDQLRSDNNLYIGKLIKDIFNGQLKNTLMPKIETCFTDNISVHLNYKLVINRIEKIHEARLSSYPENKVIVVIRDITEAHNLQKALNESGKKYTSFFKQSLIPIFSFNNDFAVTEANNSFRLLFGISKYRIIGEDFFSLFECDTTKRLVEKKIKNLEKNGHIVFQINSNLGNGKHIHLIINTTKVKLDGYVAFCLDLSSQTRLEKEIETLNNRFYDFFNAMRDGAYIRDVDTRDIVIANNQVKNIFGFSIKEINNEDMFINKIVYEKDRKMLLDAIEKFNKDGFGSVEYRVLTKRKTIKWIWEKKIIKFEDNKPDSVYGVVSDITEIKESQERMKENLEKEVLLNELKSQFISTASHEFRTPLTAILASTELLEHYGLKWDEAKVFLHFDRIKRSVTQVQHLLSEVLYIEKAESKINEFHPQKYNLHDFCTVLVEDLEGTHSVDKRINYKYKLKDENHLFDEKLFGHFLSNLIGNALKYSSPKTKVKFFVEQKKNNIVILIEDKGIGIPKGEIARIFETFFRAKNVYKIQGTGLGLSIAKHAVETHGGTISVKSVEHEGAVFTVHIPIIAKNNLEVKHDQEYIGN